MDGKFRNENEQEILKRAKRGSKITRMRPRYPRFLLPLIIVVMVVAVVLVPIFTDLGPALSFNVLEAFASNDEINTEILTGSRLKEFSLEADIDIKEDETAINGVILTPNHDYTVNGNLDESFKAITESVKKRGCALSLSLSIAPLCGILLPLVLVFKRKSKKEE